MVCSGKGLMSLGQGHVGVECWDVRLGRMVVIERGVICLTKM